MRKKAFTLLEIVFVIVIIGIISKFAVEFLAQAYRGFVYQNISNKLQNQSEMAIEVLAAKLQFRLKDSVIIRKNSDQTQFKTLEGANDSTSDGFDILEWVGYDIEGFRGDGTSTPYWSGLIDKKYAHEGHSDIYTPGTDTTKVNDLIQILSNDNSDINDSAIFIMGSDVNVSYDFGWQFECANADCSTSTGGKITDQQHAMHPINSHSSDTTKFISPASNTEDFTQTNLELDDARYKLSWSAYAVVYEPGSNHDGNVTLYYDYQPWNGESYKEGKSVLLMQHVASFRKRQSYNVMKIQVCVKSSLVKTSSQDQDPYSICKEKTIY